ncbi:MAG TPA: hypothetical protein VEW03_12510 [Longimicrobiaceae bacterium]|nr:hypothetical protein [Longimicrobiaceae bacterium]
MKILDLLERSGATEPFRHAVAAFVRDGRPAACLVFNRECPPVKVERALAKALEQYPHLPIESIEVRAASGCEFFRGTLEVHTAVEVRRVRFHWDCKWKAEQFGWHDYFGFPDQGRAAREFGHDCFRAWSEEGVAPKRAAATERELVSA